MVKVKKLIGVVTARLSFQRAGQKNNQCKKSNQPHEKMLHNKDNTIIETAG